MEPSHLPHLSNSDKTVVMGNIFLAGVLIFGPIAGFAVNGSANGAKRRPQFQDYPATPTSIYPARAKILTSSDRQFRTRIREDAAKGPNFAGKYTIVVWGCGSGCQSFVVVDSVTGSVHWNRPFSILGVPDDLIHDGLQFKVNSRLLVASGCPEDEKCGTYYFEWIKDRFRLKEFGPDPPAVTRAHAVRHN